jgi:uncharacterized protein (DUF2147 family)
LVARTALAAIVVACTGIAHAESPEGRWYAEGGAAQVEITRCGDALCGTVVWLRSPFDEDGCPLTDAQNPDATLRRRQIVGLQVLSGLRPSDGGGWTGGLIYDPSSGRTYRCHLAMDGPNRARLRGYVGIRLLGRTTTWLRVGTEQRTCRQERTS